MDFLCSYNHLKKLVQTNATAYEVATMLSAHGPSVERVIECGFDLAHIVLGRVDVIRPHGEANKLQLVDVDIGSSRVRVVCGGNNVKEGMLVALATAGARVKWHGEGELVALESTTIRGEKSDGMICAAVEIGLEKWFPHAEREIMDLSFVSVAVGTPLARVLLLDDMILMCEVTSNRPDMMCVEGIARELSAIAGHTFVPLRRTPIAVSHQKLSVSNEAEKLCPRYLAVLISGIEMKQSPLWMQSELYKAGIKPINVIVDIGNYVMLEQGQPMHAFDGKQVSQIVIRSAREGEKLHALDGKTYELNSSMLIIADDTKPIALAGVMGGIDSGISKTTTSVVWESACFNPVSIRRTSRSLLLFSESAMRFEKGLSTVGTMRALERAVELTLELTGGTIASEVVDTLKRPLVPPQLVFNPHDIPRLAGFPISLSKAREDLEHLGFVVEGVKKWNIAVPYWRQNDVVADRDIVEEIVRMHGFATIQGTIPSGVSSVASDPIFAVRDTVANYLVGKGFQEMVSYSFISDVDVERVYQSLHETIRIDNPLSSDHAYMRTSLIPSALLTVAKNVSHTTSGAMFEIANVYTMNTNGLPHHELRCIFFLWKMPPASLFYSLKGIFDGLLHNCSDVTYEAGKNRVLHPSRNARMIHGGATVGEIGEIHPRVLSESGIEARVAIVDFSMLELSKLMNVNRSFVPIPHYPGVKRDIAFFIPQRVLYQDIAEAIKHAHTLVAGIELFDVYEGKGVPENQKSMAFHIEYRHIDKTLSMEDAEAAHKNVVLAIEHRGGVVRV